jgi:hypothetical protein
MLTTLTVLRIRYPPVVYVSSPSKGLLKQTTGGYLILTTMRGAVNINYWWIPHVSNCDRGC